MNIMNIDWEDYVDHDADDDDSSIYGLDSSDGFDDTSTSGISNSSKSLETNESEEKCKKDLQRWLDSSKLSDKQDLNAKIINIIKEDSKGLFMYLIANNYKLDILNSKGQTALHLASFYRAESILNLIMDFPNYVLENHTDCNGLNYLHIACSQAHVKLVRRCLKTGVDVNAKLHTDPRRVRSKFTPLHYAANIMLDNSRNVMKILLKNGADVNAVDQDGRTPLHIACLTNEEPFLFSESQIGCNSLKFVKILLKNGSDPNARDNKGNTPLLSIVPDNYNIFRFTLDEDSNSLPYLEIQKKLNYFLKKDIDFCAVNNDGNNILHRIIENLKLSRYPNGDCVDFSYDNEYAKMIKRILSSKRGIDVNAKNYFGDTPLQLATSLMSLDIVKVLLEHGANVNTLTFNQDDQYCFCCPNSLPNLDIIHNVINIIKLLLKKGWKLTFQNNLILMKFLVHDIHNCECGNTFIEDYEIQNNVFNLMDYADAQHFEQFFDKIMDDLLEQSNFFTRDCLLKEISKALHYRKVFNLYVDKKIIDIAKDHLPKHRFKECESNSKKEDVVRMKYITLNGNALLYNVMVTHPYRIYRYVKNRNFDEITENFMHLENMVKGHVAKSLVRHHVEKMSIEYLRLLFFPAIPTLCCKLILSFLSNAEIVNICSAAILEE